MIFLINILNTVHWYPSMWSLIHTSYLYLCTCYLYLSFHWWEESIDLLPEVGLKKEKHEKYSFKFNLMELCTNLTINTTSFPRSHIFTHKKTQKNGVAVRATFKMTENLHTEMGQKQMNAEVYFINSLTSNTVLCILNV